MAPKVIDPAERQARIERMTAQRVKLCRAGFHNMLNPSDGTKPYFDEEGYVRCMECKRKAARNYYHDVTKVKQELGHEAVLTEEDSDLSPQGIRGAWLTAATTWMEDGVCGQVDPELFYTPDSNSRGSGMEKRFQIAQAKAVCATCPVIEQCKEYALRVREEYGVWGGLSERDRRLIWAEQDIAQAV